MLIHCAVHLFNVFAYSSAYPDLQKAFGDDLLAYYVHYVNFGIKENRKYTTIDATTKAGFTVSGMNGQILASPRLIVPSSADNSSVSNILSSLTLPSSAAPTPVPTPAPAPAGMKHCYSTTAVNTLPKVKSLVVSLCLHMGKQLFGMN